jgi:hypothetical protein
VKQADKTEARRQLELCRQGLRIARRDAADFPSEASRHNLRLVEEIYASLIKQCRTTQPR